jgi:sulfur carrier protein ThiS
MRIYLGGHLSWYDSQKRSWLELYPTRPVSLPELARQLGVPAAEIAIVIVNGRLVEPEKVVIAAGDEVEFHPALGGG